MATIRQLPATLANQIAAGEVIERPASVVKELVENSLDAGATSIEVLLQAAGRQLIQVSDNGSGMSAEDAPLALERHATSKLRSFEDLSSIATMGFRGEALPSIASISHFTLTTRQAISPVALQLSLQGGGPITTTQVAAPVGTTMRVEHLFYNVPARRKFLKSDTTELSHVVELIKALALAHPQVSFHLHHQGRPVLQLPAGQTLAQRLASIFGEDFVAPLLPLAAQHGSLQLQGFVSPPSHLHSTRDHLFFFINARPVDSKVFHQALRQAYGAHMGPGRVPAAFLFLTLPPAHIDVNVHPAKREVRFRAERDAFLFLSQTLSHALSAAATPPASPSHPLPFLVTSSPPFTQDPFLPTASPFRAASVPLPSSASTPSPLPPIISQGQLRVAQTAPATHSWQFLHFLSDTFALFSTPQGLAIVAVRHAQERIAFERIQSALASRLPTRQPLLIPALLQLSVPLQQSLQRHQAFIDSIGFTLQPFGQGTWRLEAVPSWLSAENGFHGAPEALLAAQLQALEDLEVSSDLSLLHQHIARLSAQHIGYTLGHPGAARTLIDDLLQCQQPLQSPSGAPTVWLIALSDLNKRFGF